MMTRQGLWSSPTNRLPLLSMTIPRGSPMPLRTKGEAGLVLKPPVALRVVTTPAMEIRRIRLLTESSL
ncbi:hypothetical protein D3C86_1665820 [compost metagenome]